MERVETSIENLITQLEGGSSEDLPMRELLGLDKQLRSIRGMLKVETAKKVQLEQYIMQEMCKPEEICNILDYTNVQREEIRKRIARLNDDLKVRHTRKYQSPQRQTKKPNYELQSHNH